MRQMLTFQKGVVQTCASFYQVSHRRFLKPGFGFFSPLLLSSFPNNYEIRKSPFGQKGGGLDAMT